MRQRVTTRRAGVSSIEVVVLAAALCLALAVAVPALQAVRAGSRANRCQNNLLNLAVAVHNYESAYRMLPPGWVTRNVNDPTLAGSGWPAAMLPFLDQKPLYDQLDFNRGGPHESLAAIPRTALLTPLPLFRCPADTTADLNPYRGGWATSNYSGAAGPLPFPRWLPAQASSAWPGQVPPACGQPTRAQARTAGIFGCNSNTRFGDVTDGTSNTVFFGERSVSSAAGLWAGVTASSHETDVLTNGSHPARPQHGLDSLTSLHVSVHIAMGDGRVQPVSDKIESIAQYDPEQPLGLYQKLFGRADGSTVRLPGN